MRTLDRALALDPMVPNALRWRGVQSTCSAAIIDGGEQFLLARSSRSRPCALSGVELERNSTCPRVAEQDAQWHLWAEGFAGYFASDFPVEARADLAARYMAMRRPSSEALALIDAYVATNPDMSPAWCPMCCCAAGEGARGSPDAGPARAQSTPVIFTSLPVRRNRESHGALAGIPRFARRRASRHCGTRYGAPDIAGRTTRRLRAATSGP